MSGQAYTATQSRNGRGTRRLWLLGALAVVGSCVGDVQNGQQPQGVVALFNPAVSPPIVPAPTDLVRAGGTLQIPVDPAEATTPALKALNDFLRSLDGFPPDSGPTATSFSGALDPNSISAGLLVYDATDKALLYGPNMTAAGATTISQTLTNPTGATGTATLTVKSASRWKVGHQYVVAVLSYTDAGAVHGVVAKDGTQVLADQAFTFLRSGAPLVGMCADLNSPACACPSLATAGCKAIVGGGALSDAQALQLENGRLALTTGLGSLLALPGVGRQRSDVAVAWSFTISSHPFAVFDPDRGSIPFPSDLLLTDPTQAHTTVNLPASPGETALQTQLRMGLDTLDGFSTTASVTFPIDGQTLSGQRPVGLDLATITKATAILANATPATITRQPTYTPSPLQALLSPTAVQQDFAGQVILTPEEALIGDNNRYVGVLTTAVKDANGLQLMPSSAMVLMSQTGSLVANGVSVLPTVPTAQALQLEALRTSLVLPTMTALGLKAGQVAALTEFRTQTITGALTGAGAGPLGMLQLAAAPYAGMIPTTVTIDAVVNNTAVLTAAGLTNVVALVYGHMTVLQIVGELSYFTPPGAPASIPFVLSVPKKTLVAATGAPVTIVQHGLTLWRGYVLSMADALAAKGLAAIGIDVIYHGGRAVCTTNADCDAGSSSTCVIPAGHVAGKCNTLPKLAPTSPLSALPGPTGAAFEKQPDASLPNAYFTNFSNFFAIRDNFRQHVLDLTQLVRVIHDATANGLTAQTAAMTGGVLLDPTHITYIGQSLGSLLGTTFMAVDPFVNLGVLSVGGGRIVDIFIDPKGGFAAGLAPVFGGLGVTLGTPQYYQLLDTLRWIVDPGDPINLAYYVRQAPLTSLVTMTANQKKKVILQEAGMDMVIANEWTRRLGIQFGLPLDPNQHVMGINGEGGASPTNVSTFFSMATHGDIYLPASLGGVMQPQAITYISTGLAGAPNVTPGN